MTSTFLRTVGHGLRIVVVGPVRTPVERRLSVVGSVFGGFVAVAFGAVLFGVQVATGPSSVQPPLGLFTIVPIPFGVLTGLRFTTDLTGPARLSWRRVIGVSVVVLFSTIASLATLLVTVSLPASGNFWDSVLDFVLGIGWLTVTTFLIALVVYLPILVPTVTAFAFVMRWLSRRADGHRAPRSSAA